jgi:uncharacterized membrane protein YtjA (UPF0391 family)
MLAVLLLALIGLAAAAFGLLGLAVTAVSVAKVLFFAALAIILISLVVGRRSPI